MRVTGEPSKPTPGRTTPAAPVPADRYARERQMAALGIGGCAFPGWQKTAPWGDAKKPPEPAKPPAPPPEPVRLLRPLEYPCLTPEPPNAA